MTTDEVKDLLDTISNTFNFIEEDYSKQLSDTIRQLTTYLTPDVVKVMADIMSVPEDKINESIADLKKVLDGFDQVFLTDQSSKIVDFCQRLKNRPLVLKMLAWQLG